MSEQDENFIAFESEAISDEEEELLGQRRESSVLFNLGSLEEANRHLSSGSGGGDAKDDASGLINIQHMTAMGQRSSSSEAEEVADPIVIAPAVPQRESGSNTGLIIGAVIGVLALAGLGVAAVALTKDGGGEKKVIVEKIIEREKVVPDPATAKRLAEAEAARKAAEAKLAEKNSEDASAGGEKSPKSNGTSAKGGKTSKENSAPTTGEPSSEKSSPEKKEADGIDGIIGALEEKKENTGDGDGGSPSNSKLPKQLSKPQVQSTIKKYNSRIKTCGSSSNSGKLSGTVWVAINIASSGKVSSAEITSSSANFKGTDLGNCVLTVVRAIKFPEAQEGLDISKYPFIIN